MKTFKFSDSAACQPTFAPIERWAHVPLSLAKLRGADSQVMIVLLAYGWRDGFAFPSLQTIMRDTELCRAMVYRALKSLADKGLITEAGDGWKIHPDGPENSTVVDIKIYRGRQPSLIRAKRKVYMATTNVRRVSGDDDDDRPAKPKPTAASPAKKAVDELVDYYKVTTKKTVASYERTKISSLYAEFGDELGSIIKAAWSKRDELVNEKYPVFTVSTLWFYAKFKHVSKPVQDKNQIVLQSVKDATINGIFDQSKFARIVAVRGLQERDLLGHIASAELRQNVCAEAASLETRKRG